VVFKVWFAIMDRWWNFGDTSKNFS
jgi:hypothetical protein